MLKHRASAVLSGRVGFNGLYYTLAPGLHSPCPGGAYPTGPPEGDGGLCDAPTGDPAETVDQLADALRGTGAPVSEAPELSQVPRGVVPTAIASGSGGKLVAGTDGAWHGYTTVRIDASGDPRLTLVEQRPIIDWLTITAQEHVLRSGQRMTLRGVARQPLSIDTEPSYLRIDSPAITHRYDLVQADERHPYMPKVDADGAYIPLDPTVATVDGQTGVVKAGKGKQARTYAIGILSVGDRAASYPLVFEPAKSFKPRPATTLTIPTPTVRPGVPQPPPPIQVLSQPPGQSPGSPPPAADPLQIGALNFPDPPALPHVPGAPPATPTAVPPAPPAPPPPPATQQQLPLSLEAPLTPISIVPTVIPPTPPPINPAPPGGSAARKEAKQRQAATAKSEEGASEERDASSQARIDAADAPLGPPGSAMTRRDRAAPGVSFTTLSGPAQLSAWARGALYGGGLGTLAFVLALGWAVGRPTPRRHPPVAPAPAWTRSLRRRG